ncbi:MAG: sulfatase [Acidobacteriota bacterium]
MSAILACFAVAGTPASNLTSSVRAVAQAPGPPDIVLIVIDTLRRDHLASYGYGRQTTPGIDRLVREGVAFDAVSPTSWTKPAVTSILTGLHPLRHQTFDRTDKLPTGIVTLAERLRAIGYSTQAVSANGWVSGAWGLDRGFQQFTELEDVEGVPPDAFRVNRAVVPQLGTMPHPFFLYVQYVDPHAPYSPRRRWDGEPLPGAGTPQATLSVLDLDATHEYPRAPEFVDRARDLYDGELRQVDDGLEELLGELERRNLLANAVLVVTADHGEELGDHGRMSHGQSLYREVTDVPLVFWAPGRIAPRGLPMPRERASLLEVTPTLMEIAGSPLAPGEADGSSRAGELLRRVVPGEPPPYLLHLDFVDGVALALDDGHRKLLLGRAPYRKELFDLELDPAEQHSLMEPRPPKWFGVLATRLAERHNAFEALASPRLTGSISDSSIRQLAALGYLGSTSGSSTERRIPRVVEPPTPVPDGRLGWEGTMTAPCIRTANSEDRGPLLEGWYWIEAGGRWTYPKATLLTPPIEAASTSLVVQGQNFRSDVSRLAVVFRGRLLGEASVGPGPMRLEVRLPDISAPSGLLLELRVDPPFVPAQHGAQDARSLGLFVTSICTRVRR